MSVVARPGTPFPFDHPTPPSLMHRRSSQPIHFSIPSLPSRTPPSLLKRSPSATTSYAPEAKYTRYTASSSRNSSPQATHTPVLTTSQPRRQSSCSSSSTCSSSDVLRTPELSAVEDSDVDIEILLDTPSLLLSPTISPYSLRKSSPFSLSRPTLQRGAAVPLPPQLSASRPEVSRPKFLRRDTPRPAVGMKGLAMRGLEERQEEEPRRQKSYTSAVDGGKWVIV